MSDDHRASLSSTYSGFYSINDEEDRNTMKSKKRTIAKKSVIGSIYNGGGGGGRADSFKTCKDDEEIPDEVFQPPAFVSP